ncbi:MAG TPA: thiamine-phosphate kinase [Nitrososphaerales archaeon]|nr:thiamine-phosphate kinase [Nitrososphaerales archaeon]
MSVIESIVGRTGKVPKGYTRIGDDVALIPVGPGKLVVKVDMLVEGTDVPMGMTYRQAARKAVAMCVSDFAAKGARPDSFLISLGLRKGVTQEQVEELAQGLRDAEREWGTHLVGGDTNESRELIIDCAMVGFAKKLVTRAGASPGDKVVVTGPFGYAPAGLKILMEGASAEAKFAEKAKVSVLHPTPNLQVGLALAPYLTSAMDSSDGLARSLHTLAKESGVGFEVSALPVTPGVDKFARMNGLSTEELVLEGGEEYVIVGTVKGSKLGSAVEAVRKAGGELTEIGRATSRKGRVELRAEGSYRPIRDEGWTHLR